LSWLAATPEEALSGIRTLVKEVVADLQASVDRHGFCETSR